MSKTGKTISCKRHTVVCNLIWKKKLLRSVKNKKRLEITLFKIKMICIHALYCYSGGNCCFR